jgi:hypothetical protein
LASLPLVGFFSQYFPRYTNLFLFVPFKRLIASLPTRKIFPVLLGPVFAASVDLSESPNPFFDSNRRITFAFLWRRLDGNCYQQHAGVRVSKILRADRKVYISKSHFYNFLQEIKSYLSFDNRNWRIQSIAICQK